MIGLDIREVNSAANGNGHVKSSPFPGDVNIKVSDLLPEFPDILPHIIIKKNDPSILVLMFLKASQGEVGALRVPTTTLDYHLGVDDKRILV